MADLRRNGCIGKVFELAELHFRYNMERDSTYKRFFPIATEPQSWSKPHFESLIPIDLALTPKLHGAQPMTKLLTQEVHFLKILLFNFTFFSSLNYIIYNEIRVPQVQNIYLTFFC